MRVRQSDLKTWSKCPLQYKFVHIDKLPRLQSGALSFGSIIHWCVEFLERHRDLDLAIQWFLWYWDDPTRLDPEYKVNYYVRGTNWKAYYDLGPKLLREWWGLHQWDADKVIAREHRFSVPIGNGHMLDGTADKVAVRFIPRINRWVLLISDYKTNRKTPTYDYLAEDLQFTAYGYASTQPEFWTSIQNGEQIMEQLRDAPRWGEWVNLVALKRMDAGVRTQRHYNRLITAVNELCRSVEMRIFVPTISGESCRYCDFREQCGLPELDENGNELVA